MNRFTRLGRVAAMLAAIGGLAYAVEGAIVVRAPQGDSGWHASGYAVEVAFIIAMLATIPLLPLLAGTASRAAHVAVRTAQLGFTAMLVSAIASVAAGETVLGPAFLIGVLAAIVGLLVLTVAAVRSRGSGWWMAPMTFAGLVLSMALGNHGGGILFGLAWIAISIALRESDEPLAATANA